MTIEFCYLIFITSDYYFIRYFIIPRFLEKKKYIVFILSCIAVAAVSAWIRALLALYISRNYFHLQTNQLDFPELYLNSVLAISFWILLILSGKMILDSIYYQNQLEAAGQEKIKAELDFLKAQINPHSLFNSLNTIYGYIDKNNQVARNIVLQFSELLRYQLYDCSLDKVDLEKEMNYIRNYVAFQQLRKDNSLIVDLAIHTAEKGLQVAPLMLVVLVENAFKFVSNTADKTNRITVRIFVTDNAVLHGIISNSFEPEYISDSSHKGIGLVNLRRRLELLYPGKYTFISKTEADLYTTELTINLK